MSIQEVETLEEHLAEFRTIFRRMQDEIARVIVGHEGVVTHVLTALMVGGHVLLEGVPGLGKTLLVRTLADAVKLTFRRIQFTPDLMPADLIGTNVVMDSESGGRRFEFQHGPIFTNILLADEINRATPKTQSALLEAMQERSVTVGGTSHQLHEPYFVLATQNPLEMEGTYPLPEAQLDRFLFKLMVEFPAFEEFELIMNRTTQVNEPQAEEIFDGHEIMRMRQLVRQVPISDEVRSYAIRLVMGSHPESEYATDMVRRYVRYGASPRAGQAMILAGKVLAVLDERINVSREDLRQMLLPSLRHRIILNFEAQAEGITPDRILHDVAEQTDLGVVK
ncbi:MAG: AAA family ATPase [Planctomycetota bacterium]|jgi:MoxR-like ATPase